ncbi:MAG: hypothetical protein E6356_14090 [Terrisporobacter othiniensis]|nr:hypothetical protein [Terrisporobacter othiniensis]
MFNKLFKKDDKTFSDVDETKEIEVRLEQKLEELRGTEKETSQELDNPNVVEYIVVEGYKGTDENMKCREFQYELNMEYVIDDDPKLCEIGFHFCENLEDVYGYYSKNGFNRFFKVKALVSKELWSINSDKYAAKEIQFIEEIKYDKHDAIFQSLKREIKDLNIDEPNYNMPSLEDNLEYILEKRIENLGFSNTFTEILKGSTKFERVPDSIYSLDCSWRQYDKTVHIINFAKALKDENVSNDMRVYLILKQIDKLKQTN